MIKIPHYLILSSANPSPTKLLPISKLEDCVFDEYENLNSFFVKTENCTENTCIFVYNGHFSYE